jgi:imidazolonepropionase
MWFNARLATLAGDGLGLGVIDHGVVGSRHGKIVYAGAEREAPSALDAPERIDCEGRWVTPGLIDCHTHLVFGGNRSSEFEARLAGASYEALAKAGGGIRATVEATRRATSAELLDGALSRLDALLAEGVTTIEIKSGYGLALDTELKQLSVARDLARQRGVGVVATFLGAHAVPAEAATADAYTDLVCEEMIPAVAAAGAADAVDAFCESIAFSPAQVGRVFNAAGAAGLPVKLHADQLSNLHGAALAARFGALSADHLEHTDEEGVRALARAGTVAVLLPGAFYYLRETRRPPIEALRRHDVRMALATDCNPGSSPLTSLLLAMNMAATLFRLTVDECLSGVTRDAARALGRQADIGTIEVAKWCDLAIWNIERLADLVYAMGARPLHARIWRGR